MKEETTVTFRDGELFLLVEALKCYESNLNEWLESAPPAPGGNWNWLEPRNESRGQEILVTAIKYRMRIEDVISRSA